MATSIITCPDCGFRSTEHMPEKACTYFYECKMCSKLIKPKNEDCCVFCSYGSVPCPPVQNSEKCC
ncbi:MAG: GDCCVxC domain-containing (seleno)protein [Balneolaceae bacterium]|nr:GDCCVxC domain-containing (seleno)protein [Balneolaceae bacterium]